MKKKVIAECIATAGYGTDSYDPETSECTHACYASIDKVISNEKYWSQYESMSETLNNDFGMGFNFEKYHLYVYEDGTTKTKKESREN